MTSTLAQKRTVIPALAGPSQNCRRATIRFPDGGTTRSNSTGPPSRASGVAPASIARSAVAVLAGPGTLASALGSHSGSSSRCSAGAGRKRSAGVTGTLVSSA
jgi:hypothetical protein